MSADGTTSQAWSACTKVTSKASMAAVLSSDVDTGAENHYILTSETHKLDNYSTSHTGHTVVCGSKVTQEDVVLFKANCLKCIRWTTSNVPCYLSQPWSKTIRLLCSILSIVLLLPTPPTSTFAIKIHRSSAIFGMGCFKFRWRLLAKPSRRTHWSRPRLSPLKPKDSQDQEIYWFHVLSAGIVRSSNRKAIRSAISVPITLVSLQVWPTMAFILRSLLVPSTQVAIPKGHCCSWTSQSDLCHYCTMSEACW